VSLLSPRDRDLLQKRFAAELRRDVTLTLFTSRAAGLLTVPGRECPTCPQVQQVLEEVVSLSPKLRLRVVDFYTQGEEARRWGVERIPCFTFSADDQPYANIKFYGLPTGYEFITLVEDILALSRGVAPLPLALREVVRGVEKDLHVQVFVTPTCPYCPGMARLAHAVAMENPRIRADVIEVEEFPYLAETYQVRGVPKTVFDGVAEIVGAVPPDAFVRKVLTVAGRLDLLARLEGKKEEG
jgi:glutaredoxin-like protein